VLNVAKLPPKERAALFLNTAQKCRMNEAIVEKDFWVCWAINYLFQQSQWKNHLAFKGGTSLSKGYNLIERFSEDIDLILDWRLLGYDTNEPWENRSKAKQDKFNKETNNKSTIFLKREFLPSIHKDFSGMLEEPFSLDIDNVDPQTICFAYPQIFADASILKVIRMEIGALAAWTPAQSLIITPYAAEKYPSVFREPHATVLTVSAERTFWEKVTILHKEAFRSNDHFPERYSRHYYDLYCMSNSPIKQAALKDLDLLEKVVSFKDRFYPANSARYDLAKPGTISLIPSSNYIAKLENDYEHMQNMIYGYKPKFSAIMAQLKILEDEINNIN